ncbi:MAG: beta-lactamase class [Gaiellaceae bacterium]|nr:beta-lactamase class [Gaiellaceae bacterium]
MIRWARVDLATGDLRHEGGDEQLPAASTIKLFVASAFWRSGLDPAEIVDVEPTGESYVEALRAPLPLGDLATLMLAVSDNAATNALLARVGFAAVNAEIRRLGLERTVVRRPMLAAGPENLTTAADLARGLAALAGDDRIVGPLRLSQHSDLPALLAEDVEVASKSGDLPSVRHEVSLLSQGERRVVLAVCSSPPALPAEIAARAVDLWHES